MSDTRLEKRTSNGLKEKGQYALAFVVIASMLVVTNIPVFVIFFFGIFAYFIVKMLATGSRNETREIFEFYLSANEILRDDDRRWYGFEIQETINRGEEIIQRMSAAPPLVRFTLGALYNKFGDHKAAVSHLAAVVENQTSDEMAYVYPSTELRNYVKILRKIERDPADAPLTSSAVRALERARKVRGKALLEASRTAFATGEPFRNSSHASLRPAQEEHETNANSDSVVQADPAPASVDAAFSQLPTPEQNGQKKRSKKATKEEEYANRKPIAEVLHDIYDRNVN